MLNLLRFLVWFGYEKGKLEFWREFVIPASFIKRESGA